MEISQLLLKIKVLEEKLKQKQEQINKVNSFYKNLLRKFSGSSKLNTSLIR